MHTRNILYALQKLIMSARNTSRDKRDATLLQVAAPDGLDGSKSGLVGFLNIICCKYCLETKLQ